jgi:hypothetical protein
MEIHEFVTLHPEWVGYEEWLHVPPEWPEILEKFPDAQGSVLSELCEEYGSYGATRGTLYLRLRDQGQTHRFAEMIACQRGPCLNTDDMFFQGSKPIADQFGDERTMNFYLNEAKKQGFTPDKNAVYFPMLARKPGDKEAWVTRAQGRTHIKNIIASRGGHMNNKMECTWRQPESDPLDVKNCVALGEDIIRDRAKKMIKANPELRHANKTKLRQQIIDKHGAKH